MKNTKKRALPPKDETLVRIIAQETPEGTYIRYAMVTTCGVTGDVKSVTTLPCHFDSVDEAASMAVAIAQAVNMPVIPMKKLYEHYN